eukprot:scaffold1042_cov345-Pavlova_lutheri.AAC.10
MLDLCAGTGTVIRSLAHVVPNHVRINYIAVDIKAECRTVIQRVFNLVQRDRPGLFLRKDIFRLGHDVKDLANRKLLAVDLIIAGVPCQPFSRANPSRKGLQDDRSLFQTVHKLLVRSQATFYAIECTPFAQHLQKDLDVVQQRLGQASQHDLSHWSAQQRTRLLWSNLDTQNLKPSSKEIVQPLTWQACLRSGWTPPSEKAPTLMASWDNTHNVRNGQSLVQQKGGTTTRQMAPEERELLVGLQPGDTATPGLDKSTRNGMLGNAFPIDTIDNDAQQTAACYSLPSPGALNSPFYQAENTTLHPLQSVLTAIDIGKISRLDALHAKAASMDADYQKLQETATLQKQEGMMYGIIQGQKRLYVPNDRTVKNLILMTTHDLPYASHPGLHKTTELLTRQYYWLGMHEDVKSYCKQCYACQLGKISRQRSTTILHPTDHGSYPNRRVTLDIAMGLPPSHSYDAVLVVADRFTKYTVYISITTSITASELAFQFECHWVAKRGCPSNLIMDQDTKFTSAYLRNLMETLGVTAMLTTAYHQQSDDQTERQISTLAD